MYFTRSQIQQAKLVPIIEYLSEQGFSPEKVIGRQIVFCSPLSLERTGSFFVDPDKNVFNDFSSTEKGDIIRLVMLLSNCNFSQAVESLLRGDKKSSFSLSGKALSNQIKLKKVKHLENKALIQYLEARRIPFSNARFYPDHLQEAYYEVNGKTFFALAFCNDCAGYELRNPYFKGTMSPKGITTLKGSSTKAVNIFEGFLDFFSALTYFKHSNTHTTIILNSLSNLSQLEKRLSKEIDIHLFLDNDNAGKKAAQYLKDIYPNIKDLSYLYADYKDFNEFISQ